tara:strand:+ start:1916 stop:2680 length:765 start_codon:yes stop_codon:yes gene_type:complete
MKEKKVIWISGASTGIGKASALKFIENEWQVAASARNLDNLKVLKKEAEDKYGFGNIDIYVCDTRDKNEVEKTVVKIEKKFGHIDIAMLNAGTASPYSDEFNLDYYNHVVTTNILGNLNCINSVHKRFKNRKKGHIAIVSSMTGYRGLPTASAYTLTKAALINLSESLFFDLKKFGVKVSVINPGFIKTPLTDKNTFPMPFLKTKEYAAKKIYDGLMKNKFEIIFPLQWTIIMKILRLLPYNLYFYLVSKYTGL